MPRLTLLLGLAGTLLLLGGLWALWNYTGLRDWASVGAVLDAVRRYARLPYGPLLMVGLFVAGGFTMFPVVVLIAATAIVFGPWTGFATALGGCLPRPRPCSGPAGWSGGTGCSGSGARRSTGSAPNWRSMGS